MKTTEFRKLIREEVRKVLSEAELIRKSEKTASKSPEIKVNDYVSWYASENERGMRVITGFFIGKVLKIAGSANMEVEVVYPANNEGDVYKVSKKECNRVPAVGEVISATLSTNGGAGSGSQGSNNITGTVTKVDFAGSKLKLKKEDNKTIDVRISTLSNIKIK